MKRTGLQRLEAIEPAIAARDAFKLKCEAATSLQECADLMLEAIEMRLSANMMEIVGRDGRSTVCIEEVCASHCLIYAKNAYLSAKQTAA
jgi:hypothetical protein